MSQIGFRNVQFVKLQTGPMLKDEIEYHLYYLEPMASLSVDTLGPLPEDENGFSFIVVWISSVSLLEFIQR